MKKIILQLIILFISSSSIAQLAVTNTAPYNTPDYLVNNVLLGNGVIATNITFTGDPNQLGQFSNGLAGAINPLGLDSGIVLSTGNINDIPNGGFGAGITGVGGDPDLLTIAQSVTTNPEAVNINQTFDAANLEFDFVPDGDTVEFRFVFASAEYPGAFGGGFVNEVYNDVFSFFISGPGFSGPYAAPVGFPNGAQNLAVVPGTTTPITISTIYVDPDQANAFPTPLPTSLNPQYYIPNPDANTFSLNGYTTVISIKFHVTCNETFHFKFSIADCQDGGVDTGVLLEAGSFSSEAVQVNIVSAAGDSTVIEGCADANIIFTRPDTLGEYTVHFDVGGSVPNDGSQYNQIADSITFLTGQDTTILNITPIADFIIEGQDTITITVYTLNPCGDTIVSSGTIYILDIPNMVTFAPDTIICPTNSIPIYVQASAALEPFTYSWTDSGGSPIGTNNDTILVSGAVTDTFYVSTTDACNLVTINDTVIVTVNGNFPIVDAGENVTLICPNDTATLTAITTGGVPPYNYSWIPGGLGSTVTVTPPQTTTYIVTSADACGNITIDSVEVIVDYVPVALNITPDISLACPNLTYSVEIIATPIDGAGPFTYNWGTISTDTDSIINVSISTPQTISVDVTDICGANASNSINVSYAPYTPISVKTTPVDSTCANEIVNLSANATDGIAPYSYLWSSGGSGSSTMFSSAIIGENIVTVTATDECTLQESTDMIVDIINCKVDIINIITPNGDDKNDFLIFKGIDNFPNNRLTVLNRWGKTIFEKDNYQNDWNGEDSSEGTYFYVLELNNSVKKIHKGTFTLLK